MPTLGAPLDFAKLEGRNFVGHLLGTAPASPVKGQLYMNTADNTLYWYDGTAWQSAKGGTGAPSGPAGGDLSGTYPNPQIAAGVITDVDVAAANKDGASALPGMRTLGNAVGSAMPGAYGLDDIPGLNPATTPINVNSQKIYNLADPTAPNDGANKLYVDNVAAGLNAKASVRCASTGNLTLSGVGQVVDGVTLSGTGTRVLVKDQTTPSQNGIYTTAVGAWIRVTDMDVWAEVVSAYVFVEEGTVNADTGWVCTVNAGGTLNTTPITWTQFSGAGQITAGAGLTKTGNQLDVGQGSGISVAADTIAVDTTVARVYSTSTHGAGTVITIPYSTHQVRASRAMLVQTAFVATGGFVEADVVIAANGDITITFAASQSANSIQTTIVG